MLACELKEDVSSTFKYDKIKYTAVLTAVYWIKMCCAQFMTNWRSSEHHTTCHCSSHE
jgi:hypothetical protein